MHLTLIRTGGIIPMTKKAEKEVDWSEDELKGLLKTIKNNEGPGEKRDVSEYQLMYDAGIHPIDWEKIPAKYKKTFDELKDNLRIVKS